MYRHSHTCSSPSRPARSRPAPRPQPPRCCCAACYACAVRNCPVHASAARACALRLCALCLCRYSHTCSSSSRCVLRSPTSSTLRGACIHRVVLVDVATHIPCRPRRHGSTKCDAYACDAHAHCGDWQNEMRCTCMLVVCTQDMHLRLCCVTPSLKVDYIKVDLGSDYHPRPANFYCVIG